MPEVNKRGRTALPFVLVLVVAVQLTATSPSRADASVDTRSQELALLLDAHVARRGPGAYAQRLEIVHALRPLTGERTALPVLEHRTTAGGVAWLRVLLPGRPNGHTGWIEQRGTAARATSWRIVVSTSRRLVTVYRRGRAVRSYSAVVGKPSTPTPRGEFFVEEDIELRPGDVGAPYAIALSARSAVLQEFDGGPGQIALHGLANVGGVLGTAASHGCIRLDAAAMAWLVERIGPGVPVTIGA
jgi:lipoprotein-anchoring transpeptidase ErfK/SrfK